MRTDTFLIAATIAGLTVIAACATEPGDALECPTCDGVTELLVGDKCVPIADVAECGPDGHSHGTECHCFSGQDATTIDGVDYCLSPGCDSTEPGPTGAPDQRACDVIGTTPEAIVPVTTFADFGQAHLDLDTLGEVTLPDNQESFLHFPGDSTGHFQVFVDEVGVFAGAENADGDELVADALGENQVCHEDFPEVWDVHVENDSGEVQPQVIRLNAVAAGVVHLVIVKEDE